MLKTDEPRDIEISIKHAENPSTSFVIRGRQKLSAILGTIPTCENEDKKPQVLAKIRSKRTCKDADW